MPKGSYFLLLAFTIGAFATSTHLIALGQQRLRSDVAVQVADLKEQLEDELKARRPEEFQFIAHVVEMVKKNQLPLKLVKETFHWARKKRPYPFVYFQRALRIRAAKLGIKV